MPDHTPLDGGYFDSDQQEEEQRKWMLYAQRIGTWLMIAGKDKENRKAVNMLRDELQKGNVLFSIGSSVPGRNEPIGVRGGPWNMVQRNNERIAASGTALILFVTPDFLRSKIKSETTSGILQDAMQTILEAPDVSSPNRIIAETLENYRFVVIKARQFPQEIFNRK